MSAPQNQHICGKIMSSGNMAVKVQLKELAEDGEQRTLALDALLGALAPAAAAARAVTD